MPVPQVDPRHISRAIALQYLFNLDSDHRQEFTLAELAEILEVEEFDQEFSQQLTTGTAQFQTQIDELIVELAPTWPIPQIATVDLNILRMSIYEGFIAQLNPIKVVVNEAIELAKDFGGETSPGFVNGVLGTLMQSDDLQVKLKQWMPQPNKS